MRWEIVLRCRVSVTFPRLVSAVSLAGDSGYLVLISRNADNSLIPRNAGRREW